MYQFLESICIIDGQVQNLELHQKRVNRTFLNYLKTEPISLSKALVEVPKVGKHKCRIVYNSHIETIDFLPYNIPSISSLKVIESENIDYAYKYLDRNSLKNAYNQRGNFDDIIISQNGLVTDSYYANLAFYDGKNWCTPTNPLLKGVKRQKYLDSKKLVEKNILVKHINRFEKVSLINAMLNLSDLTIDIKCID